MIEINNRTDMLIIVDPQNDFIDGSLAVLHAEEIIPVLNKYIEKIPQKAVSRDWHPKGHSSFKDQDGPWPDHCVQNTWGAEFHKDLNVDKRVTLINKGSELDTDAYSAFDGTGLDIIVQGSGIKRLFIGGLATDYCVKATVLDALKINGVKVYLLTDAIKAVKVNPGDGIAAMEEMFEAGAVPLVFAEIK